MTNQRNGRSNGRPDGASAGRRSGSNGDAPRVVIADSDPLARRVVRDTLQEGAGFVIPAEASDGVEAVELALYYRPDAVIMEAVLPRVDGITATSQIKASAPEVRVIIFSVSDDEDLQLEALRAGASGFVSKQVHVENLSRATLGVLNGEAAISRMITMRMVERLRALPEGGNGMRPIKSVLTPREWEVLDLMCDGLDTRQMADALVLSEDTIYSHVKNLLRKLGVHSRSEAVDAAMRMRQPIAGLGEQVEDAEPASS
jgi:NarL family two-component system response regulator LiaR